MRENDRCGNDRSRFHCIETYKCKSVIAPFVECGCNSWFLTQKEGYQGDKTEIWRDEAGSTQNSNEKLM